MKRHLTRSRRPAATATAALALALTPLLLAGPAAPADAAGSASRTTTGAPAAATTTGQWTPSTGRGSCQVRKTTDVGATMRDGTVLRADRSTTGPVPTW
ncbi:hypothetical protein [Streptomyces noursei]|uniref:hypothetical protein n=1 Tax=Streptomyces noursei TaxID=1971 RepID=UPI0021A35545|nr:hypothetical protein [Streptomyces noursei]UWS69894.1 hypothetical protein N1H47_00595 [Streptomyces noursei]